MILVNSSFESGWSHPYNISELQIPWFWQFTDLQDQPNPFSEEELVRPEVRVLSREECPEEEFFLDGDHTLKVFRFSGAWYSALDQATYLEPGYTRFEVNIYGDVYEWIDDKKAFQEESCFVRFQLNSMAYSNWREVKSGRWNRFRARYPGIGQALVGFEIICPYPNRNAGVFVDQLSLTPLSTLEYDRVCHLVPQDVTTKEWNEVSNRAYKKNTTLAKSVDDAFLRNVSVLSREVHVWNVERITGSEEELEKYVRENHNPVPLIVYHEFEKEPDPPIRPAPACMISLHRQTDEEGIQYFLEKVQPEWIKTVGGAEDAIKYKDWGAKNIDVRYQVHNSKQYIDTCNVQGYLANFEDSLEANIDYIDAVEDLNEENYTDPKVIEFCIAMSNEIARRYGDAVKLCSGNWPVGNGEGPALLEWARVIAKNNHLGGYHPYHPVHPDWAEDWMETQAEWYHLRHLYHIDPYLVANGVHIDWLGTEAGAVAGVPQGTRLRSIAAALARKPKPIPGVARLDPEFIAAKKFPVLAGARSVGPLDPTGGWIDKDALDGNLNRYIALQKRLEMKMRNWNIVFGNRNRGTTIFTVGARYVGWNLFKLYKQELMTFADALSV